MVMVKETEDLYKAAIADAQKAGDLELEQRLWDQKDDDYIERHRREASKREGGMAHISDSLREVLKKIK
jgi:hypothetical protein